MSLNPFSKIFNNSDDLLAGDLPNMDLAKDPFNIIETLKEIKNSKISKDERLEQISLFLQTKQENIAKDLNTLKHENTRFYQENEKLKSDLENYKDSSSKLIQKLQDNIEDLKSQQNDNQEIANKNFELQLDKEKEQIENLKKEVEALNQQKLDIASDSVKKEVDLLKNLSVNKEILDQKNIIIKNLEESLALKSGENATGITCKIEKNRNHLILNDLCTTELKSLVTQLLFQAYAGDFLDFSGLQKLRNKLCASVSIFESDTQSVKARQIKDNIIDPTIFAIDKLTGSDKSISIDQSKQNFLKDFLIAISKNLSDLREIILQTDPIIVEEVAGAFYGSPKSCTIRALKIDEYKYSMAVYNTFIQILNDIFGINYEHKDEKSIIFNYNEKKKPDDLQLGAAIQELENIIKAYAVLQFPNLELYSNIPSEISDLNELEACKQVYPNIINPFFQISNNNEAIVYNVIGNKKRIINNEISSKIQLILNNLIDAIRMFEERIGFNYLQNADLIKFEKALGIVKGDDRLESEIVIRLEKNLNESNSEYDNKYIYNNDEHLMKEVI